MIAWNDCPPSRGIRAHDGVEYANNLRKFIATLEADSSSSGLERACHALGWHISDQYGAYEELPMIAAFNDRVGRVAKEMKWEEFKSGPDYKPLS